MKDQVKYLRKKFQIFYVNDVANKNSVGLFWQLLQYGLPNLIGGWKKRRKLFDKVLMRSEPTQQFLITS